MVFAGLFLISMGAAVYAEQRTIDPRLVCALVWMLLFFFFLLGTKFVAGVGALGDLNLAQFKQALARAPRKTPLLLSLIIVPHLLFWGILLAGLGHVWLGW